MTKINYKKIGSLLLLVLACWVVTGHVAHAQNVVAAGLSYVTNGFFQQILKAIATIAYLIFTLAGQFLAVCATLMNIGIQLTVHLGIFIQHTPVIFTVWSIVRDLASLILIFAIIWAALQMILNLKQANYGELIKSIVIAGVLINFSFFFAQFFIDASNIISLQFFNAMAPQADVTYKPTDKLGDIVKNTIKNGSGGIAGVFTSALQVNQWWNNKAGYDPSSTSDTNQLVQIILTNYTGAVVQVLAGLSFLAGAVAALWRTIILIFLLAFSAVWIAAYAVPQLQDLKNQWKGQFQSNLIFLPVYLGFMYVSITIIAKSDLNNIVSNTNIASGGSTVYMQLIVAFAIILFMINIPLLAAIKISGLSNAWVNKVGGWASSFRSRGSVWAGGYAARRLVGKAASATDEYLAGTKFGNSLTVRDIRKVTTQSLAKNKFGTGRSYEDYKTAKKDVARQGKVIDRKDTLKAQLLVDKVSGKPNTEEYGKIIRQMSEKEKLALGKGALTDINVIKHLKKSDFDAIKKSDEFDDDLKKEVSDNRKTAFADAIKKSGVDPAGKQEMKVVKNMLKNLETDDIMDLDEDTLENPALVAHFTPSQLRAMSDAGLSDDRKKEIAEIIRDWPANPLSEGKQHPAYNSYLRKPENAKAWGIVGTPPKYPKP